MKATSSSRLNTTTKQAPKPGFRSSLNGIRVFEAAARHNSFKLAAAELAMTATAVSHQIKSLEAQLGVSLFERKVRKVNLTEQGNTLYHASAVGLRHIQQAIQAIKPQPNRLRVSTTSSFAALVLLPRLQEFYSLCDTADPQHPSPPAIDITTGESLQFATSEPGFNGLAIRLGDKRFVPEAERLNTEHFNLYGTPEFLASLTDTVQHLQNTQVSQPSPSALPNPKENSLLIFTTQFKNTHLPAIPWHSWLRANPAFQQWLTSLLNRQTQPRSQTGAQTSTQIESAQIKSTQIKSTTPEPTHNSIALQYLDQEMYGIQQAQAGRGLVFCSATLVDALPMQNLIPIYLPVQFRSGRKVNPKHHRNEQPENEQPEIGQPEIDQPEIDQPEKAANDSYHTSNVANFVASDLCYYLPEREYWQNANNPLLASFVKWLERLF